MREIAAKSARSRWQRACPSVSRRNARWIDRLTRTCSAGERCDEPGPRRRCSPCWPRPCCGCPASCARPSAAASVRTAVADAGPIEAVITATGTVVPEVEQVVSSPVDARVLRILKRTGARLKKGDPLVTLDISETQLAVDTLGQDLAIKQNQQARTRLSLEKSLIDLNGQVEVKTLQLASLRSQLARDRQLAADGLLSQELLKKSELAVVPGADRADAARRVARERERREPHRGRRARARDVEASAGTARGAASARPGDAARGSGRRADVGAHAGRRGDPEGRRHRPPRRPRIVPGGSHGLRRSCGASRRGPAGHGQGERRHARGHASPRCCRRSRTGP